MIFSIQRYLEDYFERKNLSDVDQYAVKLAHFYVRRRKAEPEAEFLKGMHRLQTAFYRNNAGLARPSVEREILRRLDAKFQKKIPKQLI